ncbi:MAG: hypothetical protein Q7U97_15395, partial [Rhodocyclaceae bacterium]|nr:hypothetical protein [Rhodocyclaceae bacterium]
MAVSGLLNKTGGTAAGVATGKALEAAAGVTPVFVVNWPGGTSPGDLAATAAAAGAGAGAGTFGKVASRSKSLAILAGGLPLSAWGTMGAAGIGTAAAGVLAAGGVGYGAGAALNAGAGWAARGTRAEGVGTDIIGGAIAKTLAFFGNEEARRAVEITQKLEQTKVGGEVRIRLDQDGRASSLSVRSDNPGVPLSIDGGSIMVMP